MKKDLLCIDPGASGGLAATYDDGTTDAWAMMADDDLREFINSYNDSSAMDGCRLVCYLELVGGYVGGKGQPGSAMFNFGNGYGYIRGLLAAFEIETHLVRPQTWQKGIPGIMGVKDKPARKRALKEHAARLFPTIKPTLKTADALCIADYARRAEGVL